MSSRDFIVPSPPFRGEREGPSAERWEGEVGLGKRSGIPHLTPTLSAQPRPKGGGKGEALSVAGSAFPPTPTKVVIPAKAGIHFSTRLEADKWIPAFAGMTILFMPSGIGGASPA